MEIGMENGAVVPSLKTKKIENILLKKNNEMVKNLNPIGWKKGGK